MWMILFAVGLKARCDQSCEDLKSLVPIKTLNDLRWYSGCCLWRDWDVGTLTSSQQAFAEKTVARFDVSSGRNNPLSTGVKLEHFDENERVGDWPFRELVGCLMLLANQTRPNSANAVRAIARYTNRPRELHWRTAVCILENGFSTRDFGITFQKRSGVGSVCGYGLCQQSH